jgi:hypothetical protein
LRPARKRAGVLPPWRVALFPYPAAQPASVGINDPKGTYPDLKGTYPDLKRYIKASMTFPTKVLNDSLGRIGSLKRTSDKSLFPMALGSCGHRITHQLRPIIMNGRSILSETSSM